MSDRDHDDARVDDDRTGKSVLHGFLIATAMQVTGGAILTASGGGMVVFIGILQVIWMIPAIVIAKFMGARPGFLKGMVLCGVVLFLLSALCFGVIIAWLALSGPWYA